MNSNASACSENKGIGLRCVRYRFGGSARCEGYHPIDIAWLGRKGILGSGLPANSVPCGSSNTTGTPRRFKLELASAISSVGP
jgi:hypothetical protein